MADAKIRLSTTGKDQVKADLQDTGSTGQAAFDGIASSAQAAGAAVDQVSAKAKANADALANYNARVSAAAASGLANASTTAAPAGTASAASTSSSKAQSSPQASYQVRQFAAQSIAQIDPVATAETNYAKAVSLANQALQAGLLTETQHASVLSAAKQVLDDVTQKHANYGNAVSLNSAQVNELTGVVRHSIDALAAGANPLTVLTQHAASLAQVMGEGEGGVGGAIGALGVLFNPVTIGVTALAAGFVLAVAHGEELDAQSRALSASLAVLSDGQKQSVTQLQATATALRDMGASTSDATAEVQAFVQKSIDPSRMIQFGQSAQDLSDVFGTKLPAAAKQVSDAFTGNYDDVKKLDDQLNFLTADQRTYIQTLFDEGDASAARSNALDIFVAKMDDAAAKANGPWKTAIRGLGDDWGSFMDSLSKTPLIQGAIAGLDTLAQRAGIIARVLQPDSAASTNDLFVRLENAATALKAAKDAQASNTNHFLGNDEALAMNTSAAQQRYDQIQQAYAKATSLSPDTIAQDNQQNAKLVASLIDSATPKDAEVTKLKESYAKLHAAIEAAQKGDVSGLGGKTLDQANKAQSDIQQKIAQLQKPQGASREQTLAREAASVQADIAATNALADAYLKSDAAALVAEATRVALTDATKKGLDTDQQAAAVKAQIDLAIANANKTGAANVAQLRDQAAAQDAVNAQVAAGTISAQDATKVLAEQTLIKPLLTALDAGDAKQKAQTTQTIKDQIAAYEALQAAQNVAAIQAATDATKLQTKALQEQLDTINLTVAARNVELARLAAIDALNLKHVPVDSDVGKASISSAVDKAQEQNQLNAANYAKQASDSAADQIAQQQLQITLMGQAQTYQDQQLADLKAIQDLQKQGIDLESDYGQQVLKAADAQSRMAAELAQAKAAQAEITSTQQKMFGDLETYLDAGKYSWKSFGDLAKQVIIDIADEMVKLSLINPLENLLTGSQLPTSTNVLSLLTGTSSAGATLPALPTDNIGSILSATGFGGYAAGTDYAPAGYAWVGEQGPELMKMSGGEQIINHERSVYMARQAAAQPLSLYGTTSSTPQTTPGGNPTGPSPSDRLGGGSPQVVVIAPQYHDFTNAVVTDDLMRQLNAQTQAMISQAAPIIGSAAVQRALKQVPSTVAKWQQNKG